MRVCVVGSGAREHALAHALSASAEVVVTPGNPGTTGARSEVPGDGGSITSSSAPASEIPADLVVIGPEAPLVAGLADRLRAEGRTVFGPGADGARLEGSKAFMKELAQSAGVPSAAYGVFDRLDEASAFLSSLPPPYVVKTDGLAAGKGVLVTDSLTEARADVEAKLSGAAFGEAGRRVIIEEAMAGPELSVLVLCDGRRIVALPAAQDFKRLGEGDLGPNTGGMGAYSPVPAAGDAVIEAILEAIVEPSVAELNRRGIDYRGVLYAGCMLTESGPRLVEYNVRFGDPEAEVVLLRLGGDLAGLCHEVATGRLNSRPVVLENAAVGVVLAAEGYPSAPVSGDSISGVAEAGTVEGVTVFHAGTAFDPAGDLVTSGGRVLCVSGVGPGIATARARAYRGVEAIAFRGMQLRYDIAEEAARSASVPTGRPA